MTEMSVELLDWMGDDLTVVNAARVSFAKTSTLTEAYELSEKDEKLIRYLAENNHWSPFAHPQVSFRVKAPIFVARQLAKHQVGAAWNEESRRYIDDEPEFYMPKEWRGRPEGSIKQGSAGVVKLPKLEVWEWSGSGDEWGIEEHNEWCLDLYRHHIEHGVAPEQARMLLPLNTMTTWIWTGSLLFWSRVCGLRLDSHAQSETREIALEIHKACGDLFPASWAYLTEGIEINVD